MNTQQLQSSLESIGLVRTLEEVGNVLNISIFKEGLKVNDLNTFNDIINNEVLSHYPNIDIINLEGNSIKGIFSK